MVNTHRVVLSFLNEDNWFYDRISTQLMPKEKALQVLQQAGYAPGSESLAKLFKYLSPFLRAGRFQKEAGLQDIIKNVRGVAPAVVFAVLSLLQTASADELKDYFNIQSSNVIETVKKTPQWIVNMMGEKGFLRVLHTQYKKMITPKVIQYLNQKDPSGNTWANDLAQEALSQIGSDSKLNQMYGEFIKANKLQEDDMQKAIVMSINNYLNSDQVQKEIQLAMAPTTQGQGNVPGSYTGA